MPTKGHCCLICRTIPMSGSVIFSSGGEGAERDRTLALVLVCKVENRKLRDKWPSRQEVVFVSHRVLKCRGTAQAVRCR